MTPAAREDGLIDWSKPADEVCRQVRAMQPGPAAYTFLHRPGKEPMRVIIPACQGTGSHTSKAPPPPGFIMRHDLSGLATATIPAEQYVSLIVQAGGNSTVLIKAIQPAEKKPMMVAEFLRSHSFEYGWRFGPEVLS